MKTLLLGMGNPIPSGDLVGVRAGRRRPDSLGRCPGLAFRIDFATPMHELSIATSLVETAGRKAEANGAGRVLRVNVRIGSLSGVEPESLSFCFPIAARETVCDGAELHLEIVPASGTCTKCGAETEVHDLLAPCPTCGDWPLRVEGGREMQLESLEVT